MFYDNKTINNGENIFMTDLTISIVSNGNRELLDRCLDSIIRNTRRISYEIFVVDNCSTDGSPEMVREKYPSVKLVEKQQKGGYSENHNKVLSSFDSSYVIILNDDVEIIGDCLEKMLNTLKSDSSAGCAGCMLLNSDGTLQQSVYRLPSLSVLFNQAFFLGRIFPGSNYFNDYKNWAHDEKWYVEFIVGACMMFPAEVIKKIGLMDEDYFIYAEDADLCKRVLDAGWKIIYTPEARMIHHGGSSMKKIGDRALAHSFISMHIYFRKHCGSWTIPFVKFLNVSKAVNRLALLSLAELLVPSKKEFFDERKKYFKKVVKLYKTKNWKEEHD